RLIQSLDESLAPKKTQAKSKVQEKRSIQEKAKIRKKSKPQEKNKLLDKSQTAAALIEGQGEGKGQGEEQLKAKEVNVDGLVIDIARFDERHRLEYEVREYTARLKLDGVIVGKNYNVSRFFGGKRLNFQIGAHPARFQLEIRGSFSRLLNDN